MTNHCFTGRLCARLSGDFLTPVKQQLVVSTLWFVKIKQIRYNILISFEL